jgi:putative transposase
MGSPTRGKRLITDTPGHAHALTFSCFRNRTFLIGDRSRGWLADALQAARIKCGFDLWAYVFMPNHVHILLFPRSERIDMPFIRSQIKEPVAKAATDWTAANAPEFLEQMLDEQPNGRRAFRFWQRGGGYDRDIWNPTYLWEMLDYIHGNPVRAGICDRPQDWHWSSASDHLGLGRGPVTLDLGLLPSDPRGRNR